MVKFNDHWKVQKHGPLKQVGDGLLTVSGDIAMPLGNFPRRMTVASLQGARVAVWSPIPLDEPQMKFIEDLGTVAFLIVPGIGHRLDIRAWKTRYPLAKVICAPGAQKAVSEAVNVDAVEDILQDSDVQLEIVPGVGEMELAMTITRSRSGRSLVLNDILANVRHPNGLGAHLMARLFGFGVDRPKIPWIGKRMFVKDPHQLALAFAKWASYPDLQRILVSHGEIISDEPNQVLSKIGLDLTT